LLFRPRVALPRFSPSPFGKYFLVDKIATGGMAEIFKAKTYGQGGFENLLVIKRILPHVGENAEFVEMFIDEAKVSVALQHPNIVRVNDFGQILDDYFIAMECVDGKDVRNLLRKHVQLDRTLPAEFAAYIAHETCKGLHYAHTKTDLQGNPYGIVHRDISPSNVLVGYDAQVKIADFGIAKAESNAYQTRDGVLKGKFEYMSPEQAEGRPLDARSDIFAVGILLWESLTGHRLFKTDSDVATLRAIQSADVPKPSTVNPDVPETLEQVAMTALSRDPDDRYQTAAQMADDLRAALAPAAPDVVQNAFRTYLREFFADEIAEERERLETNSEVAAQLRDATTGAHHQPGSTDFDGPTTSMRPSTATPVTITRVEGSRGPRLWVVAAVLLAVLTGAVGLAVVGIVVGVNLSTEAAEMGDMDVVVQPAARVYVDDVLRGTGTTVFVSRLDPGQHAVRLEADGHESVTVTVEVVPGEALRLEKSLAPLERDPPEVAPDPEPAVAPTPSQPTPARPPKLALTSTPAGARAFVDGVSVGITPTQVATTPGKTVTVRYELAGYEPVESTVETGRSGGLVAFDRILEAANDPGKLTVLLVGGGWANVFVDGEKLPRTAPLRDVELEPGSHEIRVQNEGLGIDHTESVVIGAGETVTVRAAPQ
jgi:serine/threonine protein kinase